MSEPLRVAQVVRTVKRSWSPGDRAGNPEAVPEQSRQKAVSRSEIQPLRGPGIVATQLPGEPSASLPTLGPSATSVPLPLPLR